MKRIYETAAGRQLTVCVIMRGARHVATVRIHHGSTTVTAEISQDAEGCRRSEAAWAKMVKRQPRSSDTAQTRWGLQSKKVGGYGYDKSTAALGGMWVDGHQLTNHCDGGSLPCPKAGHWPQDAKPPRGYRFANLKALDPENPGAGMVYMDCYRIAGLEYLSALGYRVILAL